MARQRFSFGFASGFAIATITIVFVVTVGIILADWIGPIIESRYYDRGIKLLAPPPSENVAPAIPNQ